MTSGARLSCCAVRLTAFLGALLAITIADRPADACWIDVPADETTLTSDAIVVGRLGDIRAVDGSLLRRADPERAHFEATIGIEHVLWLNGQAPGSLTLHWDTSPPPVRREDGTVVITVTSTDIDYSTRSGERILWFLNEGGRVPAGTYEAGSPNRTISLEDETAVRAARLDFIVHKPVSSSERAWFTLEPRKLDERQQRVKDFLDETLTALEAARRTVR